MDNNVDKCVKGNQTLVGSGAAGAENARTSTPVDGTSKTLEASFDGGGALK